MAKMYLVRHAQASFGAENYDKLSDMGIEQSKHIPKHFDIASDTVQGLYRGDMLRHHETLVHSFGDMPAIIDAKWNEFDHENVLRVHRPEIADREKAAAMVMSQPNPKKFLEDEFEIAMMKWMTEEGTTSYNEPFKLFKELTLHALNNAIATARKEKQREVVVITSGGVIAFIAAHLLDAPLQKMAGLNLSVVNTSVTALLFNDEKVSLSYFNNYSHLPKEMVTYI
jgi:broad specificity phosphatase PhoE